jgi:hypothetical protein
VHRSQAFFEHAVLPILFRRGFSDNEVVRRVQLEEALRDVDHVAVYYDRSGLITQSGIEQLFRLQARLPAAKLCAVIDAKLGAYNLTIEVETPFHPDTLQLDEAISALERCVLTADRVTRELLSPDESMSAPDPRKDVVRG